MRYFILFFVFLASFSCSSGKTNHNQSGETTGGSVLPEDTLNYANLDTATFAGGCFWCMEACFEDMRGVKAVVSGYAGGKAKNPTYHQVSSGTTGYAETVQIYYDPKVIDFGTLLDIFFTAHDPTQLNRQGPDVGTQYRSEIFYHGQQQADEAKAKIAQLDKSGQFDKPIVTKLSPYTTFYKAEAYHQNYEKNHPNDPYIVSVSRPKIDRVKKKFKDLLKTQE